MKLDKRILLLLLLELVKGVRHNRHSNVRKSVRFKDHDSEKEASSDYYFNFGDDSSKKRKQPNESSVSSTSTSKKSTKITQPQAPPKLKSALKKPSLMPNQIIYQSNLQPSTGAFDISRSTDRSSASRKSFTRDVSSIGLENGNIFIETEDNADEGPIIPSNPYRNVGPTPQILNDLSPDRFWLPPNAPMTQRIPGPFMPRYVGVPGQNPAAYNLALTSDYDQFDGVDYIGPRDEEDVRVDPLTPAEIAQQTGVGSIGRYRPQYVVPQNLQPLDPVTPLPGGNIIDPLAPEVNNLSGPFFPDRPLENHAFLFEPQQPQLVARDLEEGPYIVERVTDPIVFFDPTRGQTVLYDPLRDFTRLYNPETDPELPIEDDPALTATAGIINEPTTSGTTNGAQSTQTSPQVQQPGLNGGGFLKSMSNTKNGGEPPKNPAFWILKRLDPSELEKSGGINGNSNTNTNSNSNNNSNSNANGNSKGIVIFQSPNTKSLQNSQPINEPPKKLSKKQIISHYKAPKPQDSQAVQPAAPVENFRIQLASTNDEKEEKKVSSKSEKDKTEDSKGGSPRVTLVYRPIVDIDMKKRYGGFKAQGNDAASNTKSSIITTLTVALIIAIVLL